MHDQVELSALEIEQATQEARKHSKSISTSDLRLLRAYLFDVVSKVLSRHAELAQVRGNVVHEEIQRREANIIARIILHSTMRHSLERLATLPDLEAPAPLRMKVQRR